MAQEEKYKVEIERLTKTIQEQDTKHEHEREQEIFPPHIQLQVQEEVAMGEEDLEDISQPQEEEHLKVVEFTALEEELKLKILAKVDPLAKANMEWELIIIHSANMRFFQYGDAFSYYHLPTLPLPLLNM